ncbi:MAG: inositol monophosphatase [Planctomycetaceae bacterium]|nr:inositol monophosphatase [Planctomycetaceae bacterium]
MPQPDLQARLDFALNAYAAAKTLILGYYQAAELEVERKRDSSPVTAADKGAEQLLRAEIAQKFPGDGVLGEEFGDTPGSSGFRWILDPIDGTKSFIHGVPLFGTLIGLEYEGQCVLGVCGFPALEEVVYGATGLGAWWQRGAAAPRRAWVSKVETLSEALFCCTSIQRWDTIGRRDAFDSLVSKAQLARGWGDCYGHALVATGRADVMVDAGLNPWDGAALVPIIREAGGHFVDWKGQPTIYGGNGVSVNAHLKDEVLAILA